MMKKKPEDEWLIAQITLQPKDYTDIPAAVHRAVDPMLLSMLENDKDGKVFNVKK
jgi:hypothetical protein